MDRVATYQELIKQALRSIVEEMPDDDPDVRTEIVTDEARGHYEIMQIGWDRHYRVHGTLVHCDIVNGKIYVEHDGTDFGVADFLVENGVPREHIVLGFRHPDMRKYTDFALA